MAPILPETYLFRDIGDIQVRTPIAVGFRYGEHTGGNLHFACNQLQIFVVIRSRDEIAAVIIGEEVQLVVGRCSSMSLRDKAPSSPADDFNGTVLIEPGFSPNLDAILNRA